MSDANPTVKIRTSHGTIKVELFADKAPVSVENFLSYVDSDFYRNTVFHRVIPDFMIQGGGFTPDMVKKETNAPISNEATNGLTNERGTLAMARTGEVDSATSQFFINIKDNGFLNHQGTDAAKFGYAVFGKVVEGMDVVDEITRVPTGNWGFHQDVPEDSIVIRSIERNGS